MNRTQQRSSNSIIFVRSSPNRHSAKWPDTSSNFQGNLRSFLQKFFRGLLWFFQINPLRNFRGFFEKWMCRDSFTAFSTDSVGDFNKDSFRYFSVDISRDSSSYRDLSRVFSRNSWRNDSMGSFSDSSWKSYRNSSWNFIMDSSCDFYRIFFFGIPPSISVGIFPTIPT